MKKERKAVWRVSCETCRAVDKRYHCTWRFQSERGARSKVESIRETERAGWHVNTPTGAWCNIASTQHFLVLERWDGEREKWVKQK